MNFLCFLKVKKNEDNIRLQALMDNTAQGVFNYLKEIENKREIYDKRWIWELLQNALDSALPDQKIKVEIIKSDTQIAFIHNGRPFKPEEVAHLIYHGSTKGKQEVGKFGTGFLTTHLLSKEVKVKGVREDNREFEFVLNRNGESSDEIKDLIEKTWKDYQGSLKESKENLHYRIAEYSYQLDSISFNTAKSGIEELIKVAPYVLAFNDKLGIIEIIDQGHNTKFELTNEDNEGVYIHKVVKKEESGESEIFHELWVLKDKEVEIAVKGKEQNDGTFQIESLQGIPKIFFAFPLFDTQDIPFPVIVNSRKFKPTDKRDGIFLGKEDTHDIRQNKTLLENASELFVKLISDSNSNGWNNIHVLLNLNTPPDKDWLDKEWYIGLVKRLIDRIINAKVLKTENGDSISIKEGFIPFIDFIDNLERVEKLWDVCYCFTTFRDKIPAKELIIEWVKIFNGWKLLGLNLTEREITIEKLAEEIEGCENLQDFKIQLDNDRDELGTLNDFYNLLLDTEKRGIFDDKNILPNQNGIFKKKPDLFKDEGIDENLKDISSELGVDARNLLLHSRILEAVQKLIGPRKQNEVLNEIVNIIRQPQLKNNQYIQANIELLNWLIEHNEFEYFEGYPIISSKENTSTLLAKEAKEKPLAPKEIWNEIAMGYADLFPQELIISSLYYEKISQKDKWKKLEGLNFILTNPIYKVTEKISQEDLDSFFCDGILEENDEEQEHEITEDVELSKIAFLDMKDKGIIDTIRKSKDKARKFLGFLFNYVIENDNNWANAIEVGCNCGSKHKIYPAQWLTTLKNRSWIPIRKDKSEKPNAQYLAAIMEQEGELLKKCRQDKPSKLLSKLGISISELMMRVAAKDDKIKLELDKAVGSLFNTFMANPGQLSKIAELAETKPELFIEEIEEKIKTREQIQRNQSVGSLVENLLKNMLEKRGFKVEKTGIGSDFVIEHDFIENETEVILKVEKANKSYLIEVKSTLRDYARMTLTQGETANKEYERYFLCVVKLDSMEINEDMVKKNARFVTDIGKKIEDKFINRVKELQEKTFETSSISGDIEIEINGAQIHFKINERVWKSGKTFDELLLYLF